MCHNLRRPPHSFSRLGCVTAKLAVRAPALVTRAPGAVSGACFAGSRSPWPPPFAPPAPLRSGPLCSSASQLLWQSLTSRDRASPAMAPRLPDADRRRLPHGRSRDLPVPAQGASAHARVFDHAGSSGARDDALGCVAFHHMHGVGTQDRTLRGSMAGLCAPLSTLRRDPRGPLRMTWGRCGSLLLHRKGLSPSTPCRSPGASHILSALPPLATEERTFGIGSSVPIADSCTAATDDVWAIETEASTVLRW